VMAAFGMILAFVIAAISDVKWIVILASAYGGAGAWILLRYPLRRKAIDRALQMERRRRGMDEPH
jgi:hypothetical protein